MPNGADANVLSRGSQDGARYRSTSGRTGGRLTWKIVADIEALARSSDGGNVDPKSLPPGQTPQYLLVLKARRMRSLYLSIHLGRLPVRQGEVSGNSIRCGSISSLRLAGLRRGPPSTFKAGAAARDAVGFEPVQDGSARAGVPRAAVACFGRPYMAAGSCSVVPRLHAPYT